MTHFLVTDENPKGYKLEQILSMIRKDLISRALKVADDHRSEAQHVMQNDMKLLEILSEAIALAEDSTRVLDRALGPSTSGAPRIGTP